MSQDWTELLVQYYRKFTIPCLPHEQSTCTYIHVGLVRTLCSFRCALSNSRSSLVMLVSGRDIVHDRSTACAHDACCETFFSRDCKITKYDVHGVPASVLKTKAPIISIVLQYYSRLEKVNLFVTARAHIVRRMARFFLLQCS